MFLLNEQISKIEMKKYAKELYNYAVSKLNKINRTPKVFLKEDQQNADNMFGKTGYYDPDKEEIHLYITDRHPKDVLRSFAHELVHHEQNCRGDTELLDLSKTANDPAYASHDEGLREMEREAFERGNMIFRDWCDMKKTQIIKPESRKIMKEEKKRSVTNSENKINNQENDLNIPYPELFKEKDRLHKDRMNQYEQNIFDELLKRFIPENK